MTTPLCGGCGKKPAVCTHKAGHSVFFVSADGSTYSDPDADCYLCNDCCGHSGEESQCFRISDGVPMEDVPDDELEPAESVQDIMDEEFYRRHPRD
jgi:hypothetical protein